MITPPATRIFVHGSTGRMGARITALARCTPRITLVERTADASRTMLRFDADPHVIIDFSAETGTLTALAAARATRAALVVGTTGLSSATVAHLHDAARSIAVIIAPNTSLGVAVSTHLAREAARLLGPEFDVDILEYHHKAKKDAPSGTALHLAAALHAVPGIVLDAARIHAVRAGEIIGEHAVQFAGPAERITIRHEAASRDLFAHGALRAALWLHDRPPGLYTMNHVLGLETA